MAISYPVDPDSRWAVLQLSTGEIISRNQPWPRADGMEIVGQNPDFVMLLQLTDTKPDYDSRLYSLEGTEVVDAAENELRTTWQAVARPTEERVVAAENVEVDQLSRHVNLARELIETRLMVAAILEYSDGMTMPPQVEQMASAYKEKGVKLWRNRARLKAIITALENNEDPDLDAGWEDA